MPHSTRNPIAISVRIAERSYNEKEAIEVQRDTMVCVSLWLWSWGNHLVGVLDTDSHRKGATMTDNTKKCLLCGGLLREEYGVERYACKRCGAKHCYAYAKRLMVQG